MKQPPNYQERIASIRKELKTKTIGEIESDMGISGLDYTGVGIGYNLKDNLPRTLEEAREDMLAEA